MADTKISALTALTAVNKADLLAIIDDPSGTPVSKKITVEDLFDVITGLTDKASPVVGDELAISDSASSGVSKKISITNLDTLLAATTKTLTNKTIDTASNTITVNEADVQDLQSYLVNVVEDTTPQLGADLDCQTNNIDNVTDIILEATGKVRLDGLTGGDTYIHEQTANKIQFVGGGSALFNIQNGTIGILASGTAANFDIQTDVSTGNLAVMDFVGDDSGAASSNYARIICQVGDNTAGAEDGRFRLQVSEGGSLTTYIGMEGDTADIDINKDVRMASQKWLLLGVFTDAQRPSAGNAGTLIFNSTDGNLNIDDGTNWILPDGTTT